MTGAERRTDWKALLKSWDEQQESFNPNRERRFGAMFDLLEASLPRRFTALDLGSGPGSLSARLLRRFPHARAIAVDYDPVTQWIGRGALGTLGGRLAWVDADLGSPGWMERLPAGLVDAAVSTTALHWLTEPRLRSLYRDLGRRLPRNGIFLNGDYLPWGKEAPGIDRIDTRVWRRRAGGRSPGGMSEWRRWWANAKRVPALRPLFLERSRRAAEHPKHRPPPLAVHEDALARAGFREVDVVWQDFGERLLFARR